MENPSAYIDVALHQYFVGVFKLDFRSPSPHVKRHASQRPIDERHVDMLYNSFKESIDRLPALPLLGILGGSAKLPSTIELGSPIIFPKEVDLFIFSGQHRIKALERLAQDPDQKENAWWLVNVYSAELERNLPYHFELLVVRENHQAPKILREVHTIDLFRMCQRLANEPGHLTLRALRGGNIDQKKAKISSTEERNSSPMEKNEISPRYEGGDSTKSKETVRDFAKGFLSCLEYPIVLEGVEKIMETPIFHHYFNLYGFHCSLYPRMYNLVRAILNEVHQFWARLLENEENSQIMASRLNNLPKNNKTFQWVRKNWKINTSIVEKGPEGLEPLRVNSSNEPDWVFGDIVPLPSWVSGSGFREIVERSSRMADMAKLALGLELPTLEGVHKEREIILQTMGEKRAKFEFDCYRYSNLINSKEKDIESEFEKIWKQPRFREFMECCPHPKAKMWLSKRKTAIRLDYIPKQTIEGIPHFAVQGKYAGDLNETLDSSPSTLADSSIDRRTIGAITTTNGIPNLSKGVQDVPVVPAHQNSQETISIQSVLPGTMIRLSEHETPKTADTEPTQANALQSTQSRRHQEISPSHSLPDINSQYNVPAVEWRTIIDKISGYDLPLQIRLHDVLQRMTELADTDLYVLIQMIKDSILHNEAMVMMESLEHKTLNQNELSVSFSASSLSGMKRKRDQDDDLPLTTMSGFQSTLNSGLESMVRDCGVIDWDRHRIDFMDEVPITFILGAGASVTGGLELYRENGRILPKFRDMMNYRQWSMHKSLKTDLWNWIKHLRNVSDSDEPPPCIHRLINQCYQAGRLKHVITFNVDGLEFKEAQLQKRRIYGDSTGPFLQQVEARRDVPSVLQMHGNTSYGICGHCSGTQQLTMDVIDDLASGSALYCDACKQRGMKEEIRPGIKLYNDILFDEISVEEHMILEEAIGLRGNEPPGVVIVIGLSLSKVRVLPLLIKASKQQKFIFINKRWEPAFGRFNPSNPVIISDAQVWASEMLKSFQSSNLTNSRRSSNRKRSKVSNDKSLATCL